MSLPLLHSFAGYSIYRLSKQDDESNWKLALSCIVLANAADLDFVPGILIGRANQFHHCAAHSLGAAVICGLLVSFAEKVWKKRATLKTFLVVTAAYASHVILDYFNDLHEGIPVFWPLTNARFPVTLTILAPKTWDPMTNGGITSFVHYVASVNSLKRLVSEIIIISVTLLLFALYGELKKRLRIHKAPAFALKEE